MPYYRTPANRVAHIENEASQALLPEGSVEITEAEAMALAAVINPPPPPPTPLQQIRALEQTYADAQAKLTRQSLLIIALDKACAYPEAAGKTRAQVHDLLMIRDNGYAGLFNLETQISALRAQM